MKIGGFQKTTLLDFPGRVAAIVFTSGCNYRCPFCHNASLALGEGEAVGEEEIFDYIKLRKGILDGISVSGGEPCLQRGLIPFLRRIREFGLAIKLDTNGTAPDILSEIIGLGLVDYIAMDIKGDPEKYERYVGTEKTEIERVRESVRIIMSSGVDYEFRTTVVKELHTAEDIASAAEMIRGAKRYYLQTYKDSDGVMEGGLHAYSHDEMEALRSSAAPFVSEIYVR